MSRDGSDNSAPGDQATHTTSVQPLPGDKRPRFVTGDSTATGRNTDLATVTGASTVPDLPADEPALSPGDRVHRYVIEALVGTGGMGAVYRARDPELDRPVAIKVVRCKRHADGAEQRAHGRLLREAQALARLSHPNVVTVYDAGVLGDSVFLAMELVHGEHLARWQSNHQPSRAQLLRTYIAAGYGLAAAHAAGIVHRDFKPRNVILGDDGRVRVLDFGLAKAMDLPEPNTPASDSSTDDNLTRDGAVVGTPRYMSLEQMTGGDVDARSDQFSFCVALFEALYGYRPYDARTLAQLAEVMQSHAIREGKSSGNKKTSPKVPRWLRRVLVRGLSPKPTDRYPSMTSLIEQLIRVPRRRRRLAIATAALLGAAAFATITVVSADAARSTPCANTRANLEGIWDHERSLTVTAALRSAGRPHTEETAQLVTVALDDYATRWVSLQHGSCVATHERGTTSPHMMDLQNQCLSRRLHQLQVVSDLLSHDVDGDTVDRAVATVASLPDLRDCTESRLLTSGASKPPSNLTARVLETRAHIDEARALFAAGRYAAATPIADRAVAVATDIDYAPALAEALLVQGQLRSEVKNDAGAVMSLSLATRAAAEAGDDRIAARVWTSLLWVLGYEQEKSERARIATLAAEAAVARVERHGDAPLLRAQLESTTGTLLYKQGNYDAAQRRFETALDLRRGELGPQSREVAAVLNNLGLVRYKRGDYAGAAEFQRQVVAIRQRTLGSAHPAVASALNNLGIAEERLGLFDRALAHFGQAIEIRERTFGVDHASLAGLLNNSGNIFMRRGDPADAEPLLRRAVAIKERAYGLRSNRVAVSLDNLGASLVDQGRYADALPLLQRSVGISRETLGDAHPDNAYGLTTLGSCLIGLGRADEAVRLLQRALALRLETKRPGDLTGETRFVLARAQWAQGKRARALESARVARGELTAATGDVRRELAQLEHWLSEHTPVH